MHELLSKIDAEHGVRDLTLDQLNQLSHEIRDALCSLLTSKSAHFASNLGVVELCLALHNVFDFRKDRLIWDTGHQIYPHKLVTGRYAEFGTIRSKGGLMGYPNPAESEYDLFMTGHAGCSVSTMLGLRSGDELMGETDRYHVAVIGDGAFPSGIVYEAMNNAGGLKKNLLVILNDNKMSICPRVGGFAGYLDRLRTNPFYTGMKLEVVKALNKVPVLGDPVERFLTQLKEAVKAGLHGGMLFEDLGFRYIGPVDGHNIAVMRKYFQMVKTQPGPILLHVVTEKGHGFQPAAEDPVFFHAPPAFQSVDGRAVPKKSSVDRSFTNYASEAIRDQMLKRKNVTVLTAAMCQGNKLERVREEFPDRFFDTGICESHAVAFAGGQAKAGLRPIVDIYSTFLQRSYDQIFQEVALQNLPVVFMMDRAGLTGPDGPTHHGCYDVGYMRVFPNMVLMAPSDGQDLAMMLDFALQLDSPTAIRYPKANAEPLGRERTPIELGRAEVFDWGREGVIIAYGATLPICIKAAELLRLEGLEIGVVNARFAKPMDHEMVERALRDHDFVLTVEEGALIGGFGAALLEVANDLGLNTSHVRRIGLADRYIEHGDRDELLRDSSLDVTGVMNACRDAMARTSSYRDIGGQAVR